MTGYPRQRSMQKQRSSSKECRSLTCGQNPRHIEILALVHLVNPVCGQPGGIPCEDAERHKEQAHQHVAPDYRCSLAFRSRVRGSLNCIRVARFALRSRSFDEQGSSVQSAARFRVSGTQPALRPANCAGSGRWFSAAMRYGCLYWAKRRREDSVTSWPRRISSTIYSGRFLTSSKRLPM